MSEIEESGQGYPEEAPPGADPSEDDRPRESPAREDAERAPEQDDDRATGNPNVDR